MGRWSTSSRKTPCRKLLVVATFIAVLSHVVGVPLIKRRRGLASLVSLHDKNHSLPQRRPASPSREIPANPRKTVSVASAGPRIGPQPQLFRSRATAEGILSFGAARMGQGCIVAVHRARPDSQREGKSLKAHGSVVTRLRSWRVAHDLHRASVGVPAMVISIGRSSMEPVAFLRTCGQPERPGRCLACTRHR